MRRLAIVAVLAAVATASGPAAADEVTCRRKSAGKTAALYLQWAKQFNKCSKLVAAGKACDAAKRDAALQTKMAKARTSITLFCDDVSTSFGYATGGLMSVAVAGTAAGEGRQVTDEVYGRTASPLTTDDAKCAKLATLAAAKAGKALVKTYIRCGDACTSVDDGKVDFAFQKAEAKIVLKCAPAAVAAMLGGDVPGYLQTVRDGADRVVAAMNGSLVPGVSVVTPTPNQLITPGGVPVNVAVSARVINVPHAGYVNSVEVNGADAAFNAGTGDFDGAATFPAPDASEAILVEARTTFGTKAGTVNVLFNLGNVAPGVVITSPTSGTVTGGGSITVSGQVFGDLTEADVLLVGGAVTSFDPGTGAFSRSVTLSSDPVQIVEASVESLGLGTTNTDSVVVLRGTALPLNVRVPDANFNRLNNTGFQNVSTLIASQLASEFDPSNFIGTEAGGGTITDFSTSSQGIAVFGAGANTAQAEITINGFHVEVSGIDAVLGTCDAVYDASQVAITIQADLVGQLVANVTNSAVVFTGASADLTGGVFCDFVNLFLGDLESDFNDELSNTFESEIPAALNATLAGINVSGPIGEQLDVVIDAVYTDIPEDSSGVSFILDSNMTALSPVPDAPPITSTVVPTSAGPPILNQFVPGTGTTYDLGFCLSDGFVNRAMAAFMLQGQFNQSLSEIPFGGTTIALTTGILSLITGDPSYGAACPGCSVTLVLKPTAAPVSRAPLPAEDGDVVLIIPNYRLDGFADQGGTPLPLLSANLTFSLPVNLNVQASTISPTVGTLDISNVKVLSNDIGADEGAFATVVEQLFPLAASALGDLFGQIPLPPFQGLTISGVDSAYNVSCVGIYMNLN